MLRTNDPLDPLLEAEAAVDRIEHWRSWLLRLETDSGQPHSETGFEGRELRGAAAVAGMAELESLIKRMLVDIGASINRERVPVKDLTKSLRPLTSYREFEQLVNTKKMVPVWEARSVITSLENSPAIAKFPDERHNGPQPPLDGATILPTHLDVVRTVLGLEPFEFGPQIATSLKKLASLRNDVAHANDKISMIFQVTGRSARDIAKYLDDLCRVLIQLGIAWEEYLSDKKYLRSV